MWRSPQHNGQNKFTRVSAEISTFEFAPIIIFECPHMSENIKAHIEGTIRFVNL